VLIESDIILAAINPRDPFREIAKKVMVENKLLLSPYSPLEINMLVRAKKIRPNNVKKFMEHLDDLIRRFDIDILLDELRYHGIASVLEDKYSLTFFDSLHASVALANKTPIMSFDASYDKIKEKSFKRIDPIRI
jgi:predicted nucleic acid-binding protein